VKHSLFVFFLIALSWALTGCFPYLGDSITGSISLTSAEKETGSVTRVKISGVCSNSVNRFYASYDSNPEQEVNPLSTTEEGKFYGDCSNKNLEIYFNVPDPGTARTIAFEIRGSFGETGGSSYISLSFDYEPTSACAGDATTYDAAGTGTTSDPWVICTAEQLKSIADTPSSWIGSFKLNNDIDLTDYYAGGGSEFQFGSCGTGTCTDADGAEIAFTGIFYGQGFSIKNFQYNAASQSGVGLFAKVTGDLTKINLENAVINGGNYSGALVGYFEGTLVGPITASVTVDAKSYSGGLIGYSTSTISDVTISGEVDCTGNYIGGLVGISSGDITNITSTVNVDGSATNVGGIVGRSNGFPGDIRNISVNGNVIGGFNVGGIVGYNRSIITTATYSGTITASGTASGGIVGFSISGSVNSSSTSGSINGDSSTGGIIGEGGYVTSSFSSMVVIGADNVGGLVGYLSTDGLISKSYAAGGSVGASGDYVGGLAGYQGQNADIDDSYTKISVNGSDFVGGVSGFMFNTAAINRSYSTGIVTGADICGGMTGGGAMLNFINDSFVTGDVSCTSSGKVSPDNTNVTAYRTYVANEANCTGTCVVIETGSVGKSKFWEDPTIVPYMQPGPVQIWSTSVWSWDGLDYPSLQ
jgi:hypothetical protein